MQKTDFFFEIILSDDCSDDSTSEICQRYAQLYPDTIRFYHNKENKGLILNYYDSIKLARGKYIADLAGDDVWIDKNKLAKQVEVLESDSSIVLCHAAWKKFNGNTVFEADGFYMPKEKHIVDGNELTISLLNHRKEEYFIHLCTSMYRKDVVLNLMDKYPELFFNKRLPCEDYQLIVLLSTIGKIAAIPDCVLKYRVGHVSATSTENKRKEFLFVVSVIELSIYLTQLLGIDLKLIRNYFLFDYQYAMMIAYNTKDSKLRDVLKSLHNKYLYIGLLLKSKIVMILTSNRLIWNVSHYFYKFLKN